MPSLTLHHIAINITDIEKSLQFYQNLFDLSSLERPNFTVGGAWLLCGSMQLHLVVNPGGTFRANRHIDRNDCHFAFKTDDFDGMISRLARLGFREDLAENDPKAIQVFRNGIAGFPQLYLCDPDLNVVEVNGAP